MHGIQPPRTGVAGALLPAAAPLNRVPRATAFLVALLIGACTGVPDPDPGAAGSATESLRQIADAVWEYTLERDPTVRLFQGLAVENLFDYSLQAAQADAELAQSVLDRLADIEVAALGHDDQLTYAVLERDAEMTVEGLQYFWFTNVLTPYSSPLSSLARLFEAMLLNDVTEASNYLTLMRQVPVMLQQMEMLLRGGMERGFVVSAANMEAVVELVRSTIRPHDQGPFAIDLSRMSGLDSLQREQLLKELQAIVEVLINPALEAFLEVLETEYAPAAPLAVGLAQYPGGDDYYRYLVRYHTTLEVTPQQVQAIGREMIAQMQEEMSKIQQQIGFDGTTAQFRQYLRTNSELYPSSPEEVGERILRAANGFFARAQELFPQVPEAPFGVRRLAPSLEGSQTYGYYNPPTATDSTGYYNFNGSRLNERSWMNLAGLAYHELFPGHHFQIALQKENESLPELRRATMHTAYTEGWGSYASLFGLEQGMVQDPLSRYGVYMLEIFLGTRLVVDPGMNGLGMSLEEARQFMRDTTFESETQIATESLRYSTDMPGQALGYQMGKRKFLQLRAKAQAALGDRFDLRQFHGVILGPGSLPMTVLEQHVDWYIEQTLAAPR